MIPNYRLERCHRENAVFREVQPLTLASSVKSLKLHLWDEEGGRLVGYDQLRALREKSLVL
jgi:omega-6 fatty acid desaturase (delta-12 desaturase)